jgi:hypothetical protein
MLWILPSLHLLYDVWPADKSSMSLLKQSASQLHLQVPAIPAPDTRMLIYAYAHAHACCRVKGKAVDEVLTIKNSDIAKHLSLPPVKLHCSMLAEDAIKAAVKDWKAKQQEGKGGAGLHAATA